MENVLPKLQELITVYGLKLIAALAIFIIGRWLAKVVKNLVEKIMTKKSVEPTIVSFTCN
ncbi:MAG: mechanosensitive ion channel family protein, partial [Deltaproteobacteria bacterium]